MKLNDDGVKIKKAKPFAVKYLVIPDYFSRAIIRNKNANDTFESFSPSHKREYLDWIMGAKTESTRNKRLDTAMNGCRRANQETGNI